MNSSWIHKIRRFPVSPVAAYLFRLFNLLSLLWQIRSSDRNFLVLFPAKYKTESQFSVFNNSHLNLFSFCLALLAESLTTSFSIYKQSLKTHYLDKFDIQSSTVHYRPQNRKDTIFVIFLSNLFGFGKVHTLQFTYPSAGKKKEKLAKKV